MRFLVTGASGLLGRWVCREIERAGEPLVAWGLSRAEPGCVAVDLTSAEAVQMAFDAASPDVVLHLAAVSAMSDCARDPARARAVNATAVGTLARIVEGAGARLVMVSTDLVFDGEDAPYDEEKGAAPASVYGRTKREGEVLALSMGSALVVRLALLFGPALGGRKGFFDTQLETLRGAGSISLFDDEWRTPLALDCAARSLVAVARTDATGVLHLGGPERMSRSEMGVRLARLAGADESCILHVSRLSLPGERRVRDVSLDASRLRATGPAAASQILFADACRVMLAISRSGGWSRPA